MEERIATIYGLLAGASLGGLMLSWQGYAYIEAILLIYVAVQLVVNLIFKRPTGYITYYTTLFVLLGFAMGLYLIEPGDPGEEQQYPGPKNGICRCSRNVETCSFKAHVYGHD